MKNEKKASLAQNSKKVVVLKLVFDFEEDLLEKIRGLPGRKWHPDYQCWTVPIYKSTIDCLRKWEFEFSEKTDEYLNNLWKKEEKTVSEIKGLKGELFPFQKKAIDFIEEKQGRVLLADEQGLGKTIIALAWLQLHPEIRPAIIVCPASVKLNWMREINHWMSDGYSEILNSKTSAKINRDIVIINYDIIHSWHEELKKIKPKIVILDECQKIKENKAQRTKSAKLLCRNVPYVMGLSGTPIENRPVEIYNIVNIIDPSIYPNKHWFLNYFCAPRYNGFGWDYRGATNVGELHQTLIDTCMIRRKKIDVLKELPEKMYSMVPIELSNRNEYEEAEGDFLGWIKEKKGDEAALRAGNAIAFSYFETMKQICIKGKIKNAIQWIEDFLESGEKLVVFTTHKISVSILMEVFGKFAVKIDGDTSLLNRQKAIDDFQNIEEIKLFVGNIDAAGMGITLTASSNVAFMEFPWTPAKLMQAIDRTHRIGQKKTVNVYYLMTENTIEERIIQLLDMKRKNVEGVIDGKLAPEIPLMKELMNEFIQKTK